MVYLMDQSVFKLDRLKVNGLNFAASQNSVLKSTLNNMHKLRQIEAIKLSNTNGMKPTSVYIILCGRTMIRLIFAGQKT